jgi:hypothetical protein
MLPVVFWQRFNPEQFDFEFDEDELAWHKITIDEVIEVIWNGFNVYRNKGYHRGYQLVGRTDGGRKLKLIVYEKRRDLLLVKTGWDV